MRDHHVALDIQARDLNCRSSSNILLCVILIVMNPQALYTTIIMHICVCTAWMSNPIVRFETDFSIKAVPCFILGGKTFESDESFSVRSGATDTPSAPSVLIEAPQPNFRRGATLEHILPKILKMTKAEFLN